MAPAGLSKRVTRRISILLSIVVVAALFLDPLQSARFVQTASADEPAGTALPPLPQRVVATPIADPQLPSISVDVVVTPKTVAVGEVFTLTLTVRNEAQYPASNVVATLPKPVGAAGYPSEQASWSWSFQQLGAHSRVEQSVRMRLVQAPPGNALIVTAQATSSQTPLRATYKGGALVVDRIRPTASARFTPGNEALLYSYDGRLSVRVPGNASNRALNLENAFEQQPGRTIPPSFVRSKKGFPTFYLNATDDYSNEVHQFSQPLTITYRYTPQQLEALGLEEDDLRIFWYNDSRPNGGAWEHLNTQVDSINHVLTARVDHFSGFVVGSDFRPSETYIPSLQGWQVGLYTGAASFELPIDVPAGPAGIKPNLKLTYSSSATDGRGGKDRDLQSGWAGKGWSLNTGYVALNKLQQEPGNRAHYSLVIDGASYDLVQADARSPITCEPNRPCPDPQNPAHWDWRTTDESFMRVWYETQSLESWGNPFADPREVGRGGWSDFRPMQRHKWVVWTKDGTRYEFADDAWWGWQNCPLAGEDGFPGSGGIEAPPWAYMEEYKWHLTRVEDTHGNSINFQYSRESSAEVSDCVLGIGGTVDLAVWPTAVTWGSNSNVAGSQDRFKVEFLAMSRSIDLYTLQHDPSRIGNEAPHEKGQKLYAIKVSGLDGGTWKQVRRYWLWYADEASSNNLLSDFTVKNCENGPCTYEADGTTKKLTLTTIQLVGSDNQTGLPYLSLEYGLSRGQANTNKYALGDWNRLKRVDNGQGATMNFEYENIGYATDITFGDPAGDDRLSSHDADNFDNYRRVVKRTIVNQAGSETQTYTWKYRYYKPALNSMGTHFFSQYGGIGTNQFPNAVTLLYAISHQNQQALLVHKEHDEFRGHNRVVETDPSGNQVEHFYFQGDQDQPGSNSCRYPGYPGGLTQNVSHTDSCLVQLRNQEALKGSEYKTVTYNGAIVGPRPGDPPPNPVASRALITTNNTYGIKLYDLSPDPTERLRGLWRSFKFETRMRTETTELDRDTAAPLVYQVDNQYDVQILGYSGLVAGNIVQTTESTTGDVVERVTGHSYIHRNDAGGYIANLKRSDNIKDGQGRWLARTVYAYDGSWGGYNTGQFITKGELTLVRKYYDLYDPIGGPQQTYPSVIHSSDTTFVYDEQWGNREQVITYEGPGQMETTTGESSVPPEERLPNEIIWGPPGGGSAQRATITTYDSTFNVYPERIDQPLGLFETRVYSKTTGLLMSTADSNNHPTLYDYDPLGRVWVEAKPGDSLSFPTNFVYYYDNYSPNSPVHYLVGQREEANSSSKWRPTTYFYDGLGRQIQSKVESRDCLANLVTNKVYDWRGGVVKESQPKEFTNVGSCDAQFWGYQGHGPDSEMRWTRTEYDQLGRPTKVINPLVSPDPQPTFVDYTYMVRAGDNVLQIRDEKRHQTRRESDEMGRLIRVREYSGASDAPDVPGVDSPDYAEVSRATYLYNPLDLLYQAIDAHDKRIYAYYDSLGRKARIDDLTMGIWSYTYDVNGNLKTQRDNKDEVITFSYDALNRLTGKSYTSQPSVTYTYDQGANGKGYRTSMAGSGTSTAWQYDDRGRPTIETYTVSGLSGTREFQRWYDSSDRVTRIKYPNVAGAWREEVTYAYDAAWRQISICTNLGMGSCYATNGTYNDRGLVEHIELGNSLWQRYTYDERLRTDEIKVGTSGAPTSRMHRNYGYDGVGNVTSISSSVNGGGTTAQSFTYDHRDRLWTWTLGGVTETYQYDLIGNLDAKGAVDYSYNYSQSRGIEGGPYALRSAGGSTFQYDDNGNLVLGGGRTYEWNQENLPTTISQWPISELYTYDADGSRVKRVVSGGQSPGTTYYVGGLYEEDANGTRRFLYQFNGQVIAQRTMPNGQALGTLVYLHADHLGSLSVVTSSANPGTVVSSQEFDPWGKVRAGGVTETKLNFTGQRLDDTGLLYYNARMYDPVLARFVSPDSIVPGASSGAGGAGGTVGQEQNSKLTVDFHESAFLTSVAGENATTLQKGFWFQLSNQDRSKVVPFGPSNPQALNRYSYVANNPLRYTDANGHSWYLSAVDAAVLGSLIGDLVSILRDFVRNGAVGDVVSAIAGWAEKAGASGLPGFVKGWLTKVAGRLSSLFIKLGAAGMVGVTTGMVIAQLLADGFEKFARIMARNTGADGVAIAFNGAHVYFLNRDGTGNLYGDPYEDVDMGDPFTAWLPDDMALNGHYRYSPNGKSPMDTWHFGVDETWCAPEFMSGPR